MAHVGASSGGMVWGMQWVYIGLSIAALQVFQVCVDLLSVLATLARDAACERWPQLLPLLGMDGDVMFCRLNMCG